MCNVHVYCCMKYPLGRLNGDLLFCVVYNQYRAHVDANAVTFLTTRKTFSRAHTSANAADVTKLLLLNTLGNTSSHVEYGGAPPPT